MSKRVSKPVEQHQKKEGPIAIRIPKGNEKDKIHEEKTVTKNSLKLILRNKDVQ
jgi:deoxyxylulose-5-phosphate synthase